MYFSRAGCLLLSLLLPVFLTSAEAAEPPVASPTPAPSTASAQAISGLVPSAPSPSPSPGAASMSASVPVGPAASPSPGSDEIAPDKPPVQKKPTLGQFILSLAPFPLPKPPGGPKEKFSDVPIPLQIDTIPDRPAPLIEIGQNPFLGRGPISPGIVIPTGAVWQPVFIVFGTERTAFQTFDDGLRHTGEARVSEVATRLDLFGNLYLTPTERIVIGVRPVDRDADYTSYEFGPHARPSTDFNGNVHTLYFQGDFGELFPKLDPEDRRSLDYGFAIGRQPLAFENGIMINDDSIDAIGITRSSLFTFGASALRTTAIFGWGQINRNDNRKDGASKLLGLFTTADYSFSTVDVDIAYVTGQTGDGFYTGVGATQRLLGYLNSTFRVNTSVALDGDSAAISTGTLLFGQLSTTLPHGPDVAYLDTFWGIREYSSAARDPDSGGPLLQTGILYTSPALGRYGAPLGTRANDSVGFALGWQHFPNNNPDQQVTIEFGGRQSTGHPQYFEEPSGIATAIRFQRKITQHCVIIYDAFVGYRGDDVAWGLRSELLVKF